MGSAVGAMKTAAARIGVSIEEYQAHIKANEKWCSGCKTWHERSEFADDRSRNDGLMTTCRAFVSSQHQATYIRKTAAKVPLDPDDPRPPYLQVAALLRDAITSGQHQPGERLPSRAQLVAQYKVSAMTVVHALRELRGEGLIVSRQGSGVFVCTQAEGPEARLHIARRVLGEIHRPIGADDQHCRECRDVFGTRMPWPCATYRHLAPILDQHSRRGSTVGGGWHTTSRGRAQRL